MQTTTVSSICPLCKEVSGSATNSALPSHLCEECRAMLATILPQAASGSTIIVDAKPPTAQLAAEFAANRDAGASNPFGFAFESSPAPVTVPPPALQVPATNVANHYAVAPPIETPPAPAVNHAAYEAPRPTASSFESFDDAAPIVAPMVQASVEPSLSSSENHYADFYFQSDEKAADATVANGNKTADIALPIVVTEERAAPAPEAVSFNQQTAYQAEAFYTQPAYEEVSFDTPQTPEAAMWQAAVESQPQAFANHLSQPTDDNSFAPSPDDNSFPQSPYAEKIYASSPSGSGSLNTPEPETRKPSENFSFAPPPQPMARDHSQIANAEPQYYPPVLESPAPRYYPSVQEPPVAQFYTPLPDPQTPSSYEPQVAPLAAADPLPPFPADAQHLAPVSDNLANPWDTAMDHYPVLMVQQEKRPRSKPLLTIAAVVLLALAATAGYFLVYKPYFGNKPVSPTQRAGTPNEENKPTAPPLKPQASAPAATPTETPATKNATTPAATTPDTQAATANESKPTAETPSGQGKVSLQAASFPNAQAAKEFSEKLIRSGIPAYIIAADLSGKGRWYRVRVGRFMTAADAEKYAGQAKQRAQATGVNLQLVVCAYDNP
ncbi:MAG: SPOR domain-containing protein [Acidobacteria bacterium]|nr:SPOR domain-containing protein [Acidobacteriota bacterium]